MSFVVVEGVASFFASVTGVAVWTVNCSTLGDATVVLAAVVANATAGVELVVTAIVVVSVGCGLGASGIIGVPPAKKKKQKLCKIRSKFVFSMKTKN